MALRSAEKEILSVSDVTRSGQAPLTGTAGRPSRPQVSFPVWACPGWPLEIYGQKEFRRISGYDGNARRNLGAEANDPHFERFAVQVAEGVPWVLVPDWLILTGRFSPDFPDPSRRRSRPGWKCPHPGTGVPGAVCASGLEVHGSNLQCVEGGA